MRPKVSRFAGAVALFAHLIIYLIPWQGLAQPVSGQVIAWGSNTHGQTNVPASASNVVAVAAGTGHSLALRNDGTVLAWGWNNNGQTNVPASAANVIAIAAGGNDSVALRADGTVVEWGDNGSGQTNVPVQISGVTAISAGYQHTLALTSDGTVHAWGNNSYGQCSIPPGLRNVIAISAGEYHSMALRSDGSVVVWGWVSCGSTQVAPFLSDELVAISGGGEFSSGLRRDGTAVVWGCFGNDVILTPAFSNLVAIAAGPDYCVAVQSNGQVVVWAQVGSIARPPPAGLQNAVAVAAGDSHSLALRLDGRPYVTVPPASRQILGGSSATLTCLVAAQPPVAYQWLFGGMNIPSATSYNLLLPQAQWTNSGLYQLVASNAIGAITSQWATIKVSPTAIQPPSNTIVAPGGTASLSVVAVGLGPLTYQWKRGVVPLVDGGRILGSTTPNLTISNATATDSGSYRVVVTAGDGSETGWNLFLRVGQCSIAAWGNNSDGRCYAPPWLSNVVQLVGGSSYSLALDIYGNVTTWGASGSTNLPSNLGYVVDLASDSLSPIALTREGKVEWWNAGSTNPLVPPPESDVVAIAGGVSHCLGLRDDGSAFGWDLQDSYGEAKVPTTVTNAVALAGGYYYSLALLTSGTVAGWGRNAYGLLSLPAGETNVTAISAGSVHNLAIRPDGSVFAWGLNSSGQTNVPAQLSNVVAVAAGSSNSATLTADGRVVVWGDNSFGQTNVPSGLTNVLAIASGSQHLLAQVGDSAPCVSTPPVGLSTLVAMPVNFKVTATGTSPLSYQWQFNGQPIAGATAGNLAMFAHLTNIGPYQVMVTNSLGSVTSSVANLNVGLVPEWGFGTPATYPPPSGSNIAAITASAWGNTFLALNKNGTVVGWGDNNFGQTNIPPGLSNVTSISTANYHCLAARQDGTVAAWGYNSFGVTNVPPGLSNVVQVSAGGGANSDELSFSLALKSDGTVVGWGSVVEAQPPVPPGLSNVVSIAAGNNFALALKSDGTVFAWGDNQLGQTSLPPGLSNVVQLAAGGWFALALRNDGHVLGWGANAYGETSVPTNLSNVVAIAAGYYHSIALRQDGTVVCWGGGGAYNFGQAVPPIGLRQVIAIAGAQQCSLALQSDGAPNLTVSPFSQSALAGSTVTLTAFGVGPQPITYQWQFNGVNIAGATNALLTLSNARITQAGSYRCVVSSPFGSVTSAPALLTVTREPLRFDASATTLLPSDAGVRVRLLGLAGAGPIVLFASGDLINWIPVLTNAPTAGSLDLVDTTAGPLPNRFYRAMETSSP